MSEQRQNQNNEIADGTYDATCTGEVQYGVSSTGGEQVAIELILATEDAVWSILAFAGKARAFSISKLKACGWPQAGDIGEAIKGHAVQVRISYRNWTNEDGEVERRMNVDIVDGSARFKFAQDMTTSQKDNFLLAITANAPPPANDRGYPADWDKTAKPFSLNKPKAA